MYMYNVHVYQGHKCIRNRYTCTNYVHQQLSVSGTCTLVPVYQICTCNAYGYACASMNMYMYMYVCTCTLVPGMSMFMCIKDTHTEHVHLYNMYMCIRNMCIRTILGASTHHICIRHMWIRDTIINAATHDVASLSKVEADELAKATRVVVEDSLGIAKCLQDGTTCILCTRQNRW